MAGCCCCCIHGGGGHRLRRVRPRYTTAHWHGSRQAGSIRGQAAAAASAAVRSENSQLLQLRLLAAAGSARRLGLRLWTLKLWLALLLLLLEGPCLLAAWRWLMTDCSLFS
jgi:hypothetical protein